MIMLGHGVGAVQPAHGLFHVSVVRGRMNLQGALRGVGLMPGTSVGVAVDVVNVIAEKATVSLLINTRECETMKPLHLNKTVVYLCQLMSFNKTQRTEKKLVKWVMV